MNGCLNEYNFSDFEASRKDANDEYLQDSEQEDIEGDEDEYQNEYE